MKRKLCGIIIVITIVLLGMSTVSNARFINQELPRNMALKTLNEQKLLGSAYVYGDGIEGNTVVDAVAGDDLIISISSQTEIVDFYITYDITCDGDYDEGRVYFLLQINGEEQGQREVKTFYSESGNLVFEDVEVSRWDILTFEIGAVYTNLIPPFVIPDIAIGGGLVISAASFNLNCEQLSQHFSQPAH